MFKKIKFIAIVLAIFLITVFISACSQTTTTGTNSEKTYITDDEISKIYSSPKIYKGKHIKLKGKVFNEVEKDNNGIYFQMWGNPEKGEMNTLVAYMNTDIDVESDTYVEVDGKIEGEFKGKNAFGGEVIAPRIIADSIKTLTYQEAVAPTIKEGIITNSTVNQLGYEVTVNKVEFSQKETRVYVTVNNNGKSKFSLYSFNALAIQGAKQYKEETNYQADYPEIETDLRPGLKTEGIITFPKLEISEFKLSFEASTDDWQEDLKEFIFNVTVN